MMVRTILCVYFVYRRMFMMKANEMISISIARVLSMLPSSLMLCHIVIVPPYIVMVDAFLASTNKIIEIEGDAIMDNPTILWLYENIMWNALSSLCEYVDVVHVQHLAWDVRIIKCVLRWMVVRSTVSQSKPNRTKLDKKKNLYTFYYRENKI